MKTDLASLVFKTFWLNPAQVYWSHCRALAENHRLDSLPAGGAIAIAQDFKLLPDRQALLRWLPANGVCAEVGVATGDFSKKILEISNVKELNLIDLWRGPFTLAGKIGGRRGYRRIARQFRVEIASKRVRLHRGCSFRKLLEMPNGYFDWVYIDASHRYQDITLDLATAAPKIKPSGYLCGHDYTNWGLHGLCRFGVVEAVNQFCVTNGWKLVCLTNERHRHISYALQRQS